MEYETMNTESMIVKHGETVNRISTVDSDTQKVRLFNVSKNDSTGQNYKVDWNFDFSNCSEAEILELAARSAVIAYRKNFRGVAEDEIPTFAEREIDVKADIITSKKVKKSPVAQVKNLLQGLSPEQRAALLSDLGL